MLETVKCDERIAVGEDNALGLLVAIPDLVRQERNQQAEDDADRAKEPVTCWLTGRIRGEGALSAPRVRRQPLNRGATMHR